jgi:two-component system sensor histidine kinase KdpD
MLQLVTETGEARWTSEESRLIQATAEQVGRAIERDRLRREATEAEVLRKTEDVRQAVLAAVSHDLRTPLASIRASAESLAQRDVAWSPDERRSFLGVILQEATHLTRLVENLLGLGRIEAGRLLPDRSWYPVDQLIEDVVARVEPLLVRHSVAVDVPDLLPPAPIDYVQIGEVLQNLIENAVKYTPPGATISIAARNEGEHVLVSVADDGPGIPPQALPHVFEKFFRVRGGDRSRTRGSGLGLALARGFVEAHGGTIGVQSPPPGAAHGTRFWFTLPYGGPGWGAPPPLPPLVEAAGTAEPLAGAVR